VTEWEEQGNPTSPFGPNGADWSSPDDLLAALAATLAQGGVTATYAVVPGDDPDVAVGWLRMSDPRERATLAIDLRLRIERADGSWSVTGVEQRRHCRLEPAAGDCPDPDAPSPAETAAPVESEEATDETPGAGGVYLALGDSVTFGIGVPRPAENGFVARVAEALSEAEPPISETRTFAVPGETAAGFRDRRLDDVLAVIRGLGPRVELVTIGLGANEVLRVRREEPCIEDPSGDPCRALVEAAIGQAAGALDTILDSVRDGLATYGSNARVLVLAYYNPDLEPLATETIVGSDGGVACDAAEAHPGLNDRIACVADARSAILVDLHDAFLGRETELTHIDEGDIHPNASGYQVIADAVVLEYVGS
jgi:lysophospholipase L1-like esterase